MSAVPITITGILTTENGAGNATFVGMASLTGLGIGGGPIVPDEKPPHIWGPTDPRPTPPIHLGPGGDIGGPPVIGGGPIIPPPPIDVPPGEPNADGFIKDPPSNGGWGYHTKYGWMFDPGDSKPGPR